MKLSSALLLSCLLMSISSVFAQKDTDSPPLQTQPPPAVNNTGQCNAGYLVQGPPGRDGIEGPPGREGTPGTSGKPGRDGQPGRQGTPGNDGGDGQPGRDGSDGQPGRNGVSGKQGPPGPPGPGGLDVDELREIVRLITKEEVNNLTSAPQDPIKVRSNASRSSCPGLTPYNPATSCRDVLLCNRFLPSGYYWIQRYNLYEQLHSPVRVYCYMKEDKCGIAGIMRVGYLNFTKTTTRCPAPLTLYSASGKKLCGPTITDRSKCDLLTFHTLQIPYNFVCGKAVGYGYYQTCAFYYSTSSGYNTIDSPYLSGLSITNRKQGQRQHIWSYAAGYRESGSSTHNCPCAANPGRAAPPFVGNDFHCESGSHSTPTSQWYTSNPLWDGKGCYSGSKCCTPECNRAPWFWKTLPVQATSDIEVRWCQPAGGASSDRTGIEQLEIYVY